MHITTWHKLTYTIDKSYSKCSTGGTCFMQAEQHLSRISKAEYCSGQSMGKQILWPYHGPMVKTGCCKCATRHFHRPFSMPLLVKCLFSSGSHSMWALAVGDRWGNMLRWEEKAFQGRRMERSGQMGGWPEEEGRWVLIPQKPCYHGQFGLIGQSGTPFL